MGVVEAGALTQQEAELRAEGLGETKAASLLLADGACFRSQGVGPDSITSGELVFTTAMTGYQEALTDPSYRGQLLVFTYPLIGNYGVLQTRAQSSSIQARGAILSTLSTSPQGQEPLKTYFEAHKTPAIVGVDTRAIVRKVREHGAMPAALSVHPVNREPSMHVLEAAIREDDYNRADLVGGAGVTQPTPYGQGSRLIAVLDCGTKQSIVNILLTNGETQVVLLPANTPASDILALRPDGVVISNGAGNPEATTVVDTVRRLYGQLPMFGICLGHQLLALAAGGKTYKLKFGHRGANQPVQDCDSGAAYITTQNHGYAVHESTLPEELLVSHRNLNDGTVEGLRHRTLPIRSLQFHPEGSPGPKDASVVLEQWVGML